jgi:hypothetical protein
MASNYGAYAVGSGTRATGFCGVAMGALTTASGQSSFAMGTAGTIAGDYCSFAQGFYSSAMSNYGVAMGQYLNIDETHENAYVFGRGAASTNKFNSPKANSFSVGFGKGSASAPDFMVEQGKVGINTATPDQALHVVGNARVTGDIYYGTGATVYTKPDFVFKNDYEKYLDPIEVDNFIQKNGHLPWVTKAEDEIDEGVNMTRMQFETLETVENLQLQIINLKKEYNDKIDVLNYELELEKEKYIELLKRIEVLEKK